MQFHPTTLYIAGRARLLITEAMRGEGAILKNNAGESFMAQYHELGDLAPRDVVSQAIVNELRQDGSAHVWLDASHLGSNFLRERFPTIYQACADLQIDIGSDWMPVHPSAHYHCGGIVTDLNGATSLQNCFAAGEVATTGLHGANRLASNSLLEALVMGRRAGAAAAACGGQVGRTRIASEHLPEAADIDVEDLTRTLRATCWRQVGIERNEKSLRQALRSLDFWSQHQAAGYFGEPAGWQLQNLLIIGRLIAQAALDRPASVGTHSRQDSQGEADLQRQAYCRVLPSVTN